MNKKQNKIKSLTAARVREVLDYFPETGGFKWTAESSRRCVTGSPAGRASKPGGKGEKIIGIDRGTFRAACLAFLWMGEEVPEFIQYKNGNRMDTRWGNLVALTAPAQKRGKQNKFRYSSDFCPLTGWSGCRGKRSYTTFNSKEAFFRSCVGKQNQVRAWDESTMNEELVGRLNCKCRSCPQAGGSRTGRIIVDLRELDIRIDPDLGRRI